MESKIIVVLAVLAIIVISAALFVISRPVQQIQPTTTTTTIATEPVGESEIMSELETVWMNESDDVEIGEMI